MVKETARNAFGASIKNDGSEVVKISETMLREVVTLTRPSVSSDEMRKYERMRDDYMKRSNKERPPDWIFSLTMRDCVYLAQL